MLYYKITSKVTNNSKISATIYIILYQTVGQKIKSCQRETNSVNVENKYRSKSK